MPSTRITVTLPPDAYDSLSTQAEESGRKLSDLVRDAVHQYLFKERWQNIGEVVMEAIRTGRTNADALAAARARFPQAKTTIASVAWYRSHLRSEGEKIPTDAEVRRRSVGQERKSKRR